MDGHNNRMSLDVLARLVHGAPPARWVLDQVPATPETVRDRAEFLAKRFPGQAVVFLGDHDLTSLAFGLVQPGVRSVVVDVDQALLEYIDATASELGLDVVTTTGDLRYWLPPVATAGVVFVDPPYTPAGLGAFLARSIEALSEDGRIVLAYGSAPNNPALGLKGQKHIASLSLLTEELIPDFNRYLGAPALGGSSDLYVLRPTAGAVEAVRRFHYEHQIYSKGPQAINAAPPTFDDDLGSGFDVVVRSASALSQLYRAGLKGKRMLIDLAEDPGHLLLPTLLATSAPEVTVLVANSHPDLATAQSQGELRKALAPLFDLRFKKNTPDRQRALVEGQRLPSVPTLSRHVLERAHGKVDNTWQEGLIRTGQATTKKQAAALIPDGWAGLRPIDLPRHRLLQLLELLESST